MTGTLGQLAHVASRLPRSLHWRAAAVRTRARSRAFDAIGAGTVILRPRILRGVDRIRIGADCAIYGDVWLQCEDGGGPLVIGDRAYLGFGVHLHAVDPITLGDGCVLADGVYVGSADHDREDRHAVHGTGPVTIGDAVFIGQRAVVLGGVTIGDGATIGAHAVVTRDVPDGATVVGIPARVLPRRGGDDR